MNWWAKTILVLGLATLASGCSSNSPKPTPASTSGASETATTAPPTAEPTRMPPTVDPKAPAGGPPPANYPPPRPKPSAADQATLATDPLVVYADEVGSTLSNGRKWPVVEVVSYNLRTGRIAGLFRVGEVGEFAYPARVMLAGRKVVMNLEKRLVVANLDGSGMRTLFAAPEGGVLTTFAISPDKSMVAVGAEGADLRDKSLSFLVFVDFRTGTVVKRIEQPALAAAGLRGSPGVSSWLSSTKAIRVSGITHTDGAGGSTVIAGLDGTARAAQPQDEQVNASAFKSSSEPSDFVFACSLGTLPRRVAFIEPSSGRVVGLIAPEGRVVLTQRWSPDASTLLFHTLPIVSEPTKPGGECFQDESPPAWKKWSASGIHDVPDLRALLQQWDGPRFIDLICKGAPIVMEYPLNAGYLVCENSANTPPATLVIGGKLIGQIHQAAVVGFID